LSGQFNTERRAASDCDLAGTRAVFSALRTNKKDGHGSKKESIDCKDKKLERKLGK
jgi:hypothetical protein